MRTWTRRLTAAGVSDWGFTDERRLWLGCALNVSLSSNGNLTYRVEHIFDNIRILTEQFALSRTTTTATLTLTNHGLHVGDYLYFEACGAPFDGGYAVAGITNQSTLTFAVDNSGATAQAAGGRMSKARVFPHAALVDLTASADGNYSFPPFAWRLNVTAFTAGYADLTVIQQGS